VVRGGDVEAVEGERPPRQRVVIVEFPTMERAREWYRWPEYAEALALRDRRSAGGCSSSRA
jgi:uncharacterized protein (DUF1330 family)